MSLAWEVTQEDIEIVLNEHGVKYTEEISDLINDDEVEHALLHYVSFDAQCNVALSAIEDQLIEAKVISGPKKFPMPEDEDPDFEDEIDEDE